MIITNFAILMARYFIEMAYNGAAYHGWQVQPNAVTVQQVIDDAFNKVLRSDIHVVGAGRTDTGVHASYFVAHFDCNNTIENYPQIINKVNRILHNDVVVFDIQQVNDEAHSRFSATQRRYEYVLTLTKNPFLQGLAYKPSFIPDFEVMNKACEVLFDYIDFTSFSKLHTDVKTNNCLITKAIWENKNDKWIFTIQADRFLRNMVRAIVGTLMDVGRGKISIDDFRSIIERKNRSEAGMSVPPEALFLVDIAYPDEIFKPRYRPVFD
jgi:tRNA pseudouridine38-40 synthase